MRDRMTIMPSLFRTSEAFTVSSDELKGLITAPIGPIREATLNVQRQTDPKAQDAAKKRLSIVIANGVFSRREDDKIEEYSQFIIMDYDYKLPDELQQRDEDWQKIITNPLVRLAYHSPRGGIKALVCHDNQNIALHGELYRQIDSALGIRPADAKCCNLSRAHFISYDKDAYYNENSTIFNFKPTIGDPKTTTPLKAVPKTIKQLKTSNFMSQHLPRQPTFKGEKQAIAAAQKRSDNFFPIVRGHRNNNTFRLASLLHDYGVSEAAAEKYLIIKYIDDDFTADEIRQIVVSAYK